jgi:tetratricopeptide (TPR) repeat protein
MNLIHARSELISGMGIVGAFLVYIFIPPSRRWHLYLVPMLLGALAKTPSVIFAPLLVVYILLFEERISIADLFKRAHWPALIRTLRKCLPALLVGALTFYLVESQNAAAATYGGGGRLLYLQTQLYVWLHYTRLFFLPIGLTTDTDWTLIPTLYDTRVIAGALFIGLLLRLLWTTSRDPRLRPVTFGLAWYALTLLPASSIFPLAEVVNEHRIFQPYIGLSLAVVWGIAEAARRLAEARPAVQRALTAILVVLALAAIGAQALGTYERNTVYASDETLWRDVVAKSPGNGRAWMNYGLSQMSKGDYAEARRLYERALVLNPNYALVEVNLGIANGALKDPAAAERHFQRALQLQPDEPAVHYFFARWLREQQRLAEAIVHLQRTVGLSPAHVDARHLLMETYVRAGRVEDSKALARETLTVAPGDAVAARYANAQPPATLATAGAGTTPDELMNLSLALYQSRDFAGSIAAAKKALALSPDLAEAHNNIAAASASLGQWDEAIAAARQALRLKPDLALAKNNLAWAESEKKKAAGSK